MNTTRYEELEAEVQRFHKENPDVWRLFNRFAIQLIESGQEHGSVSLIFERIRWEQATVKGYFPDFKLNNNYRSFYARAFMNQRAEYRGFFRTRKQTSKACPATGQPKLKPKDLDHS